MSRDGREARDASGRPPPGVIVRLTALRALYVPERRDDARARLAAERPASTESFEVAVGRRLRELRALSDLTRHLHRATFPS